MGYLYHYGYTYSIIFSILILLNIFSDSPLDAYHSPCWRATVFILVLRQQSFWSVVLGADQNNEGISGQEFSVVNCIFSWSEHVTSKQEDIFSSQCCHCPVWSALITAVYCWTRIFKFDHFKINCSLHPGACMILEAWACWCRIPVIYQKCPC